MGFNRILCYLLVKIHQCRSIVLKFLQEIDRNISNTKVIPTHKGNIKTTFVSIKFNKINE